MPYQTKATQEEQHDEWLFLFFSFMMQILIRILGVDKENYELVKIISAMASAS